MEISPLTSQSMWIARAFNEPFKKSELITFFIFYRSGTISRCCGQSMNKSNPNKILALLSLNFPSRIRREKMAKQIDNNWNALCVRRSELLWTEKSRVEGAAKGSSGVEGKGWRHGLLWRSRGKQSLSTDLMCESIIHRDVWRRALCERE